MLTKNLILTGGDDYHPFAESSQTLAETLLPLGIESDIYFDMEEGLTALSSGDYQLLTMNTLRWQMLDEKYTPVRQQRAFSLSAGGQQIIKNHMQQGGHLLAIHGASICFDNWSEWPLIVGGTWQWGVSNHPPLGGLKVWPCSDDPIVSNCEAFTLRDELYSNLSLQPGIEVLLEATTVAENGQESAPTQPVFWKHHYAAGRVIYDALCHDVGSLEEPTHNKIIQQAARWLLDIT